MTQLNKERLENLLQHNDETSSSANAEMWEVNEMARRLLAAESQEPVAWTDAQELRDVEKHGCGYLFTVNPITPNADPRRVIKLYAEPQTVALPVVDLPSEFYSSEGVVVQLEKVMAALAVCGIKYERKGNACRAAMLNGGKS